MSEDEADREEVAGATVSDEANTATPAGLQQRVEDAAGEGAFSAAEPSDAKPGDRGLRTSALMGVPVSMRAVLGTARVPVSEFLALTVGATVHLDRRVGEPVDIVVNDARVASGEIVMMDEATGQLGIRITAIGDEAEAA